MSETTVITDARIIDGTGADPIENGAVLVEDEKIAAVGPAAEVDAPTGAREISAGGKTVMPGIVEGHAHVGGGHKHQQRLRVSLQRGITTICSVSAQPAGMRLRDSIEAGRVRGCSRLVAGVMITPTNGHVRYRDADGPWEVRKAVREMVEEGADFIKTAASGGFWGEDEHSFVRNYTQEELDALTDEAHAWGKPVVAHCHTQPGVNNCVEAKVDQIHHGAYIDEEGLQGILDNDLFFVPTLRVTSDRNVNAWPDRPWMAAELKHAQETHREGVRLANEMGVKMGLGVDYPGSGAVWPIGTSTMYELQLLVDVGLTEMEALLTSFQGTPEAYRMDDEIGTLEPGKKADVLVVDGDPLDDITVLNDSDRINLVMKDGTVEAVTPEYQEYYTVKEAQPPDRPAEDPSVTAFNFEADFDFDFEEDVDFDADAV